MNMATNNSSTIVVERKMAETPFFIDMLTNKHSGERQIQVNESYLPKDAAEGDFNYGRKNVNINIIDVPAVVQVIAELYEQETGNKLELE
jgi:hypothetical protein